MNEQRPQVSILMAAHNAATFLRDSVQSILDQSLENFEFVIINDGSTDDTPSILESFRKQDSRIKVINQHHSGLPRSLNHGLRLCVCDLVARMDADDISLPNRLAKQVAFMDAHPEISVLGCRYRRISSEGSVLGYSPRVLAQPQEAMWRLPFGSTVPHPGVIYRRDVVLEAGAYDEDRKQTQDYDLWCRLVQMGHQVTNLPDHLLDYRVHANQASSAHGKVQSDGAQAIALGFFSWALSQDASTQAVADIRRLCNRDFTGLGLDAARIGSIADLAGNYVIAVGKRFSQQAQKRARRYLAKNLSIASLKAAARLDACSIRFLNAAVRLMTQ